MKSPSSDSDRDKLYIKMSFSYAVRYKSSHWGNQTRAEQVKGFSDFTPSQACSSFQPSYTQPHKLSETHETRPSKPPAAQCVNVQTGFGSAPRQRSAEPVCGVRGAELEKSALHLQDKLWAQGWQPVDSRCRTMPVPINRKSLWPPLLLGIL